MRPAFTLDLGDGWALALREPWRAEALHALTRSNVERLKLWEPWAHFESTPASQHQVALDTLHAWVNGTGIPCVLLHHGEVVGAVGSRIDLYTSVADVGYWIGAAHEGRGGVTRGVTGMLDLLFGRGVERVEIRTAAHNVRSRTLAARLGFTHEGTLRRAFPVGGVRHDLEVHGLLAEEWRSRRASSAARPDDG